MHEWDPRTKWHKSHKHIQPSKERRANEAEKRTNEGKSIKTERTECRKHGLENEGRMKDRPRMVGEVGGERWCLRSCIVKAVGRLISERRGELNILTADTHAFVMVALQAMTQLGFVVPPSSAPRKISSTSVGLTGNQEAMEGII